MSYSIYWTLLYNCTGFIMYYRHVEISVLLPHKSQFPKSFIFKSTVKMTSPRVIRDTLFITNLRSLSDYLILYHNIILYIIHFGPVLVVTGGWYILIPAPPTVRLVARASIRNVILSPAPPQPSSLHI